MSDPLRPLADVGHIDGMVLVGKRPDATDAPQELEPEPGQKSEDDECGQVSEQERMHAAGFRLVHGVWRKI